MLETIKRTIKEVPFISFEEHFLLYLMQVQDDNIDNEVAFLLRNNLLSVMSVDKLIDSEVRIYNDKLCRIT